MVASFAARAHAAVEQADDVAEDLLQEWAWRSSAAARSEASEPSISGHTQ